MRQPRRRITRSAGSCQNALVWSVEGSMCSNVWWYWPFLCGRLCGAQPPDVHRGRIPHKHGRPWWPGVRLSVKNAACFTPLSALSVHACLPASHRWTSWSQEDWWIGPHRCQRSHYHRELGDEGASADAGDAHRARCGGEELAADDGQQHTTWARTTARSMWT